MYWSPGSTAMVKLASSEALSQGNRKRMPSMPSPEPANRKGVKVRSRTRAATQPKTVAVRPETAGRKSRPRVRCSVWRMSSSISWAEPCAFE